MHLERSKCTINANNHTLKASATLPPPRPKAEIDEALREELFDKGFRCAETHSGTKRSYWHLLSNASSQSSVITAPHAV